MNNELCISASAAAIDGAEPQPGDEITLQQVAGRVARREGDKLYVTVSEADGQPVLGGETAAEEAGEPPESDGAEATEDDLRKLAANHAAIL